MSAPGRLLFLLDRIIFDYQLFIFSNNVMITPSDS